MRMPSFHSTYFEENGRRPSILTQASSAIKKMESPASRKVGVNLNVDRGDSKDDSRTKSPRNKQDDA